MSMAAVQPMTRGIRSASTWPMPAVRGSKGSAAVDLMGTVPKQRWPRISQLKSTSPEINDLVLAFVCGLNSGGRPPHEQRRRGRLRDYCTMNEVGRQPYKWDNHPGEDRFVKLKPGRVSKKKGNACCIDTPNSWRQVRKLPTTSSPSKTKIKSRPKEARGLHPHRLGL